jgi:hypothetical protein
MSTPGPARPALRDLDDDELDRYILARLAIVGVDLSVLPEDDEDAPADQVRILRSARNFLRSTVPTISNFVLDPQDVPPALFPAALLPDLGGTPGPGPDGGPA